MKYLIPIALMAFLGCQDCPDCSGFDNSRMNSSEGDERYDARYDLDGNGQINILDFGLYQERCGG